MDKKIITILSTKFAYLNLGSTTCSGNLCLYIPSYLVQFSCDELFSLGMGVRWVKKGSMKKCFIFYRLLFVACIFLIIWSIFRWVSTKEEYDVEWIDLFFNLDFRVMSH